MTCHCCSAPCKTSGARHCGYSCTNSCPDVVAKKRLSRERSRKKRPQVTCKACGLLFSRDGKRQGRKFCSPTCYHSTTEGHGTWRYDREEMEREHKAGKSYHRLLWRLLNSVHEKKESTERLLGYTFSEFKRHMEQLFKPGMSWDNHGSGSGKWNIDHIRPVNTFPHETSPSVVNSLTNIRPLWWEENCRRPKNGSDVFSGGWSQVRSRSKMKRPK